jgi:probable phosphoglycerate mutase
VTEILLIRHGETAWNAERRLQGHLDIPLNDTGRRQATALGQALLGEQLDAIIASDLLRARQTAQEVAAPRGMTVHIEPGVRERCYGAFEGMLYTDIGATYPEAFAAWKARDVDARFPEGVNRAETLREFAERAVGTIGRIAKEGKYRKVALVTHGGVLDCAYRAARGIGFGPERDFDVLNASINRLVWNGDAIQVSQWGDVSHLQTAKFLALDEIDK